MEQDLSQCYFCKKTYHLLSKTLIAKLIERNVIIQADMIVNNRFLGLCQVHKGMRWGVEVGGFECGKGCWEEA